MSSYRVGSFVLHSKMQDLGAGEIVMIDKGAIRIRFASGERSFAEQKATPYLEVTAEGPAAPAPTARKKAARKTATKRATKGSKPSSPPVQESAPPPADDD
ncbi:MAG: hypothetical protein ABW252_10650 [Polyangiales bacterium]